MPRQWTDTYYNLGSPAMDDRRELILQIIPHQDNAFLLGYIPHKNLLKQKKNPMTYYLHFQL